MMSDCKCRPHVIISDTGIIDARIEYCPKHKAAPWMYEALREIAGYPALSKLPPVMALDDMRRIAREALALADGSDA